MTEILLVNTNREIGPLPVMPIGLCQVASSVARAGIPCELVDLAFERNPLDTLRREIAAEQPRLIGLTIRNVDNCDHEAPRFYLPFVERVVDAVREVTRAPIVIGGTGTSLAPRRVLASVGADLAVAGPGERALVDLYRRLVEGGERLEDLPRVTRGLAADADDSPGPQFARWLDLRPYRRRGTPLSAQSRRGCPFRCVYCEYAHLEGSAPYRLADIDLVVERIHRAVKTTGIQVVEFVDSTFNAPEDYTIRLCEELARTRVAKAYHASGINPRFGSREVLEAMKAANVTAVYCSPDTVHPATIEAYRKDFKPEQLSAMARDTAALGLPVLWSFILGGPGETPETAREVLRFIREEIDPMHVVMLTPRMRIYPGTALEKLAADEGYPPVELDLRQPDQFYLSKGIAAEEMDVLLREAVTTVGNLMTMSAAQAKITGVLNRINGLTGRVYPNWKDYPRMRRGMRLVRIPWT